MLRNENEPIMCLLKGGGYAQYMTYNKKKKIIYCRFVAVHKDHIIPVPKNISVEDVIYFINLILIYKITGCWNT